MNSRGNFWDQTRNMYTNMREKWVKSNLCRNCLLYSAFLGSFPGLKCAAGKYVRVLEEERRIQLRHADKVANRVLQKLDPQTEL